MCTVPGIREELHQKGQEADNRFGADELVYRRFKSAVPVADWEEDQMANNLLPLSNDSYNRSRGSEPGDVLLNINASSIEEHFLSWGIFSLPCKILLTKRFPLPGTNPPKQYQITPEHKPTECMYPHTELVIYDCTTATRIPDRPKSIKAVIRRLLYKELVVVQPAG